MNGFGHTGSRYAARCICIIANYREVTATRRRPLRGAAHYVGAAHYAAPPTTRRRPRRGLATSWQLVGLLLSLKYCLQALPEMVVILYKIV